MANSFVYSNYTFDDSVIYSATITTEQSLLSEMLSGDTLTLVIHSDEVGDKKLYTVFMEWYHTVNDEGYVVNDGNLENYTYGTPITYYRDGVLYGKFYVTQIERTGPAEFTITAISAIGMMAYMNHKGGVYPIPNQIVNAGQLIDDIMTGTGFSYYVQPAVRNTAIQGYLPFADKMSNLQQVLFAIGASVTKDASGNIQFVYNLPSTSKSIDDSRIKQASGKNVYVAPATRISLTEHLYYQNPNSESEEIYTYSGSTSEVQTIILPEPVVADSITAPGMTIIEKGATYISFTGTGTIYGIKYTHITTEKVWEAETVHGEENEKTVNSATLVTASNSANVMNRLVKYYTQRSQSDFLFETQTEKTGDYVTFDDRFGNETNGFISKLDLNIAKAIGSQAEVITNWYPTDTGNNFNAYQLIQSTGTITVPTAARGKEGRLVLIGGFRGGQGGSAGEDGKDGERGQIEGSGNARGTPLYASEGGKEGGKGGKGGVGCMVYTVDIASLPASFTVNEIGAGGAGGAAGAFQMEGSMGVLGGNTRVTINGTTYSSASGTENTTGFVNFVDGTFYNYKGQDGFDNTTGTGGGVDSPSAGSFTANGTTWNGGKNNSGTYDSSGYSSWHGGYGGGAAYGANGGDGAKGSEMSRQTGTGGNGATPITPTQASFPYGGNGGHGGGCGGGTGSGWEYYGAARVNAGSGGKGGSGSQGGQGSNGAVLFYYGI